MIDLEEREHGVLARLRDLRTNETKEIFATYVVGADGAASTVRRLLNIPMSGKPLLNYTTHVLFRSEELPKLHDKGEAYRFIFIGPEGTWPTITSVNGNDLWRMQLIGSKDKRSAGTDEIRAALLRAVGRDFDYSIIDVMPGRGANSLPNPTGPAVPSS